ncbi:hypothetical protein PENTCL1PPCAC_10395, partial [Pristionchus entomophagus]
SQLIIGTRPGERPCKLKIEPGDRVHLPWTNKDTTFSTTVTMTNPTAEIQLYKIKCTDNAVFRVQPPFGILDAKASEPIKVYLTAKKRPEENKHFLMILHHAISLAEMNSKKNPAKMWKGDPAADGITRLQAQFDEPKKQTAVSVRAKKCDKTSADKTSASVEEKKSPRRKSQKSTIVPVTVQAPSKMDDKKKDATGGGAATKKKSAVRKKGSSNSKDKTSNTAEEKTTF